MKTYALQSHGRHPVSGANVFGIALVFRLGLVALMTGHGAVQAHPDGEIACRAQVSFENGSVQQIRGELMLDEHHSRQALGSISKSGKGRPEEGKPEDTPAGVASMQRLRAVLNQQFGRFNWLFTLRGDGVSQPLLPAETPDFEIVQNRILLKVHYNVSSPKPARLWTLHCSDPTYYWSTRFETGTEFAQAPSVAQSSKAEAAEGHRNIVVQAKADDPAALRLDGCPGRRAAQPEEQREQARKGVAQLDWVCVP